MKFRSGSGIFGEEVPGPIEIMSDHRRWVYNRVADLALSMLVRSGYQHFVSPEGARRSERRQQEGTYTHSTYLYTLYVRIHILCKYTL